MLHFFNHGFKLEMLPGSGKWTRASEGYPEVVIPHMSMSNLYCLKTLSKEIGNS